MTISALARAMARSKVVWAGVASQLIAVVLLVFWFCAPWGLDLQLSLVNYLHPNADAPDNLALAITYSFRLIGIFLMLGFLLYAIAIIRIEKREMRKRDSKQDLGGSVLKATP